MEILQCGSKEEEAIGVYRNIIEEELNQDIIDYGAKPGLRAIHVLARAGEHKIVKKLLEKRADVNFRTSKGLTALHYAAISGSIETIEVLLSYGAYVNAQSFRDGRTPLYSTVEKGYINVARCLLKYGADPTMRTNSGISPRELALISGNNQISSLLEMPWNPVVPDQMQPPCASPRNNLVEKAEYLSEVVAGKEVLIPWLGSSSVDFFDANSGSDLAKSPTCHAVKKDEAFLSVAKDPPAIPPPPRAIRPSKFLRTENFPCSATISTPVEEKKLEQDNFPNFDENSEEMISDTTALITFD